VPRSRQLFSRGTKERKRDGSALGDISRVIDMQMVAAVIARRDSRRTIGIAQHLIEIDHSIEQGALADPRVNLLTHLFFFRAVKAIEERLAEDCTFERGNRGANHSNTVLTSQSDEVTMASDQAPRVHTLAVRNE